MGPTFRVSIRISRAINKMGRKRKLENLKPDSKIMKIPKLFDMWKKPSDECLAAASTETINEPINVDRQSEIVESVSESVNKSDAQVIPRVRPVHKVKQRSFREEWKHGRPWLEYDTAAKLMYCLTCKRAQVKNTFTTGCDQLKKDSLANHEKGKGEYRLYNFEY